MDQMIEGTALRIFEGHGGEPQAIWHHLQESGLDLLWVAEEDGGFGLGPADGFGLMRLAGRYAANVPIAETLLATKLLTEAGIKLAGGPMTIVFDRFQHRVEFAGDVANIICIQGDAVTVHAAEPMAAQFDRGDRLPLSDLAPPSHTGVICGHRALLMAAMMRSAQATGALEAVLDLTIEFAEQREQFGRPIARFQAIQHLISDMGVETAAAGAALDAAISAVDDGTEHLDLAVGAAKYQAARASGVVSENAHQVHGAIGYTHEYRLGTLTRKLWQWREEFGSESFWADRIGNAVRDAQSPIWEEITKAGAGT